MNERKEFKEYIYIREAHVRNIEKNRCSYSTLYLVIRDGKI